MTLQCSIFLQPLLRRTLFPLYHMKRHWPARISTWSPSSCWALDENPPPPRLGFHCPVLPLGSWRHHELQRACLPHAMHAYHRTSSHQCLNCSWRVPPTTLGSLLNPAMAHHTHHPDARTPSRPTRGVVNIRIFEVTSQFGTKIALEEASHAYPVEHDSMEASFGINPEDTGCKRG